jgi:transposase
MLYRQARRRGKRHRQAVRVLMRAWLWVMWACWHTNSPYQVNHYRAERRLTDQATARAD